MSIDDKDGVVRLLERLERVCREVKGLDESIKQGIAVQAGCLVNDLEVLQDEVTQALEVVRELVDLQDGGYIAYSDLIDERYYHEGEINCRDSIELVIDSLDDLHRASSEDQERVIHAALDKQDTISINDINTILENIKKPWRVIDSTQYNTLKELIDNI